MPILRALRRRLVAARDALDGWLHPRRRARARREIRRLQPESVLFVCLGNVCRSPYGARVMEARLARVLADGAAAPSTNGTPEGGHTAVPLLTLRVDSAGFIGPDRPPPDTALAVARARGLDHADHRSKALTHEMLDAADVTFVFDRGHVRRLRETRHARLDRVFWLGDFDPRWTGKRAIIDPWGKPPEEFEVAFARIERCVDAVLEALRDRG